MNRARVAILMSSKSDIDLMLPASELMQQLDIDHEMRILSAHRTPERTAEFARTARGRGLQVIICAAGGAAHLAGMIAAQTSVPVIGIPLSSSPLAGHDALLATVQMPRGVPVATVAVDASYNAALLAAQILGVADERIRAGVNVVRATMTERALDDDRALQRAYAADSKR